MVQEIHANNTLQTVEVVEKETLFLKDFIEYWKVIRNHRTQKIEDIKKTCRLLFEKHTKPFIEKWEKHIEAINIDSYNLKEYFSFDFTFPSGNYYLIPHKILVFESLIPNENIYHFLRRISTLKEFLFYFQRTCKDANFPLKKKDVHILNVLSSNKFTGVSDRFPVIEELAKICNCDPQTYRRRTKRLEDSYILSHIYLLDLPKIGYETFISISRKNLSKINDYDLVSINYNTSLTNSDDELSNEYQMAISQIPFIKPYVYHSVKNEPNTILWQKLSYGYCGNNLSSLTPSVETRWKMMPPILSVMNWDDEVISANSNNGITFDLIPKIDPYQISKIDMKILGLFEKYPYISTNSIISEMIGINEKTVKKALSRIINMNLIRRFAFVRNIGYDVKPWVSIIGNNPNTQGPIIKQIVRHLKDFPFSWLFYDYGDLETGRRPIVVGLIYLPALWVKEFFVKFSLLADYGFSIQIDMSYYRNTKWNINVEKTYPKEPSILISQ